MLTSVVAMILSMPSYSQELIEVTPDKYNQKVIKRYNRYYHRQNYGAGGAEGYTAVFGVRTNSVMSTGDVEVNVVKRWVRDALINDMDNRLYFVVIKNKTDKPIYIDKSKCYRTDNDGNKYCYFTPNGDSTNMAQRIIVIPPHSKKNLSEYNAVVVNNGKYPELKIIDYPEDFNWDSKSAGICEGFLQPAEVRSFTEDKSPYYKTYQIAYSKDENISAYSLLTVNFYMRQLIGCFIPELYMEDDIFDRLGGDEYTITNCEYGYGGVNRLRRREP